MFIPASRTRSSARAQLARRRGARPTGSSGVQTAPRQKTGTPLTCRSSPSRSRSCSGPGPAASSRKPTRPASIRSGRSPPSSRSATRWSAGSPCVCGHQRAASRHGQLAARPRAASRLRDERERRVRWRPEGPSSSTATELGARAAERRAGGASTARTPPAAVEAGAQLERVERRAARRRSRRPRARARRRPGRARSPGSVRAASCGRSAGCRRRRAACASARAGGGVRLSSGAERAAADRELVARREPGADLDASARRTSSRSRAAARR